MGMLRFSVVFVRYVVIALDFLASWIQEADTTLDGYGTS